MTQEITRITVIPGRTKVLTDYQRGDIGKPMFPLDNSWMLCCPGCGSITYYPADTFLYEEGTVSTKEPLHCHGSRMRQRYSIDHNEVKWL